MTEIHGYKYICVSHWLSRQFTNQKIEFLPYIIELHDSKKDLKKKLKINDENIVIGCHGGESSFDLKFVKDTLINFVSQNEKIYFIFLNISKFCDHPRIIFLKGSANEEFKKEFLNTCDAMIYGRSLGETFGMSCGEFAVLKKLIISYKFNRHRSHVDYLSKDYYVEYSSKKSLERILKNFDKKKKLPSNKKNEYLNCSPEFIMKKFEKLFIDNERKFKLSFYDYFINYRGFLIMNYYYIRHKVYNHYYRLIESRFFK